MDLNGTTWLDDLLHLEAASSAVLNNYQAFFTKCFPGNELEHKFGLPTTTPIYRLAADIADRICHGELPNFILNYRDEFQTWDYVNHLYRIDGPPDAQGYVSFIPTAVGGRIKQKRKWFVKDAFMRREEISDLGQLTTPFADYVRDTLNVDAIAMPPFRRVRYDVNLESVRSGHVFGIFIDRCTLIGDPSKIMCQCEVEYVKSRTAGPADADLAVTELDAIADWTQRTLGDLGYPTERSVYSKLSFLEYASSRAPRPRLNEHGARPRRPD